MFINKVFGIDRIFQKISVHTLSCLALFLEMLVTLLHLILRMFSCHLSTSSSTLSCLFSLPKCLGAWGTILPTLVLQHGICISAFH